MAAFDNVSLASPPNGPAWLQAAAQMMNTVGNQVGQLGTSYQQGQDWRYQQNQRNFFQDQNNQATLQQAFKSGNYAPLMQALIQQGGTGTASQLLPELIKSGASRSADQLAWGQPGQQQSVNTGPANNSSAAGPQNIQPNSSTYKPSRFGYGTGEKPNLNELAANYNIPQSTLETIAQRLGVSSPEDELTPDQQTSAKNQIKSYLSSNRRSTGTVNPVAQPGIGDQESQVAASAGNELKPASVQGGPAISPAPTSGSGNVPSITVAQNAPGSFNDRFAPTNYKVPSEDDINRYETSGNNKLRAAGTYGLSKEKAEALRDAGNKDLEIAKQLREERKSALGPTEKMKESRESGFRTPQEYQEAQERGKLKAAEYGKMFTGIQATDRAAADSDEDMRAMRGILNDPHLYTMSGQELVKGLRGALINAGLINPNARLPNEALQKITSKALQAQMAQMRDDAAQIGGSAGRVMLAQVRIMQDASQNPDMSPSGLRYLTEVMERSNQRSHDIAQLARDYNQRNGRRGLDEGFDQVLADYSRKHPLMTDQEIEHHQLMSSPHLPSSLTRASADQVANWAHQQGLRKGDPIRVGDTYPPVYKPAP